jgi:DNA/RNA-binding domain of Phe-tRNA-synthetase-like protein
VVPAGGFDLGPIARGIELRPTRPGDRFHQLGGEREEAVPPGEVAYLDGPEVLTRHFVWRQSEKAAIRPQSGDVLLMSEVLAEVDPDGALAAAVLGDLASGIAEHFGVSAEAWIVEAPA